MSGTTLCTAITIILLSNTYLFTDQNLFSTKIWIARTLPSVELRLSEVEGKVLAGSSGHLKEFGLQLKSGHNQWLQLTS